MEIAKVIISVLAVVISIASFAIAQRSAARARRAEAISHLLGEKETVAFAALKLLRDGLPADRKERALVLAALLQAAVFERSDRARALLYRVVELNRATYREDFKEAIRSIDETFLSMKRYHFTKEQLDIETGNIRLAAVRTVIDTP